MGAIMRLRLIILIPLLLVWTAVGFAVVGRPGAEMSGLEKIYFSSGSLIWLLILIRIGLFQEIVSIIWVGVVALCEFVAWYVFLAGSYLRDRRRENIREFIALADRLHPRSQERKNVLPLPPGG